MGQKIDQCLHSAATANNQQTCVFVAGNNEIYIAHPCVADVYVVVPTQLGSEDTSYKVEKEFANSLFCVQSRI
jgi:hypothetical protein